MEKSSLSSLTELSDSLSKQDITKLHDALKYQMVSVVEIVKQHISLLP